ncbi:MAG TPA: neutral zinc metallopeptidase [Kineosporiaceae bacterium]
MPIDFDDQSVDVSGVDDRRGGGGFGLGGGGIAVGGGVGVVGAIIWLLFTVLGGGGGSGLQVPVSGGGQGGPVGAGTGESAQQLRQRCNGSGALQKYTDCRLIKTFNVANTVWRDEFARRGLSFHTPRFAFFTGRTQTGCGPATAQVGPFYCPAEEEIYFELGFLEELQTRFGAQGQFAQAYIVAHEYGHHLQTLLGTEPKVRAAQQRNPGQANRYSIALELQADCYAGVWATLADRSQQNGIRLSADNIAEAVNAAQAVGDDRIQAKVQGRVNPESWTHGSAAQRKEWFLTGEQTGDIDRCTTFG